MPTLNLSELELEHIRETLADAISELKELHEGNYYIRELQDCIDLLTPEAGE